MYSLEGSPKREALRPGNSATHHPRPPHREALFQVPLGCAHPDHSGIIANSYQMGRIYLDELPGGEEH